ncbi:MAG: A/G-specific adenine glycosylase [Tepidiformaceae bacterium]
MAWYTANGRHELPWRLTRDPYAVLVSEVMLQQTQVDRVLPYYRRWLERWPTVEALAAATPGDVIREWAGLGYNRRALSLQRLAVEVSTHFGGAIPDDFAALRTLPGVGPYTAAAVASFAFEQSVPVADTNIARAVARVGLGVASQKLAAPLALLAETAAWLPAAGVRDHNLALMDLGAIVCRARAPSCDACPLAEVCRWRGAGFPAADAPLVRAAAPFEHTARFARGRIVDALRAGPVLTEFELAALLPERHAAQLAGYLAALERDGLIARAADGVWALPGDEHGSGQ